MGAKKKQPNEDEAEDRKQPLQGVLLAEDWKTDNDGLRPLTLDVPKALFPLLNRPLIDYQIQYLTAQHVQEIYIVCVSTQVELYVQQQDYPIPVRVWRYPSLIGSGDALREVDKLNVIVSDPFVLMNADTITNISLAAVLREHAERRKVDSSAIFTMVLSRAHSQDNVMIGTDPQQRVLLYDRSQRQPKIPCSFFTVPNITVSNSYTDLLYVCSPDVLARISDEFDYLDVRKDFIVNSVAEEEEGLQNRLYAYTGQGYGKRVSTPQSLHIISKDLLRSHMNGVSPNNHRYKLLPEFCYWDTTGKTRVHKTAAIRGPGTMLGRSCFVGDQVTLTSCVLGKHCHVGADSNLLYSYLWEDVQVGKNAKISNSILASGVIIKDHVTIEHAVIGAGCVVDENVTVPPFTRLTISSANGNEGDDDDWGDAKDESASSVDDGAIVSDTDIVGPQGMGRVWKPDCDSDDEEDMERVFHSQCIGAKPPTTQQIVVDPDDFSVQDDDDDFASPTDYDDAVTFDSHTTASQVVATKASSVDVLSELKSICLEFEQSSASSPIENLAIELNSYKFSQNATYSDCTHAATLAILELLDLSAALAQLLSSFRKLLERWAPLLQKMSIGTTEEKEIVVALEKFVLQHNSSIDVKRFRLLLQTLHDEEIVSEEAVLAWADARAADTDPKRKELFESPPVQDFLTWLREEADEEDDSDDESEEEDSE